MIAQLISDVGDKVVLPRFKHLASGDVGEKQPGDYVTVADLEAESRMTSALKQRYPKATVIGEESIAADPNLLGRIETDPHVWLIDPLDGTGNFVSGNPDFGMMLTELMSGSATRSWIWQPVHRHMYVARLHGGVWKDGVRVWRARPQNSQLNGASSAAYMNLSPGPSLTVFPMKGACAVDYPDIIDGRSDFLIHNGRNAWDHFPGMLMLEELQGVVRFADGEAFSVAPVSRYRLVAAASESAWDVVTTAMKGLPLPPAVAPQ